MISISRSAAGWFGTGVLRRGYRAARSGRNSTAPASSARSSAAMAMSRTMSSISPAAATARSRFGLTIQRAASGRSGGSMAAPRMRSTCRSLAGSKVVSAALRRRNAWRSADQAALPVAAHQYRQSTMGTGDLGGRRPDLGDQLDDGLQPRLGSGEFRRPKTHLNIDTGTARPQAPAPRPCRSHDTPADARD